jgi:hypothetical protein
MIQKKDDQEIRRHYHLRQNRQIIAIAIALFLVLLSAVLYKRPLIELSKGVLFGMQAVAIAAFLGFTAVNWRCPACGKRLGSNINRRVCAKCGARLQ